VGVSAARVTGRRGCCFSAVGLLARPTSPRRALLGRARVSFGCGRLLKNFAVCGFASVQPCFSRTARTDSEWCSAKGTGAALCFIAPRRRAISALGLRSRN